MFPFAVLIVVSLLTRRSREEVAATERLAARLLTPLAATPEEDAREVALAHESPDRHDHTKLFGPRSSWQFGMWSRVDAIGFVLNVLVVFAVVGVLVFFVNLGA